MTKYVKANTNKPKKPTKTVNGLRMALRGKSLIDRDITHYQLVELFNKITADGSPDDIDATIDQIVKTELNIFRKWVVDNIRDYVPVSATSHSVAKKKRDIHELGDDVIAETIINAISEYVIKTQDQESFWGLFNQANLQSHKTFVDILDQQFASDDLEQKKKEQKRRWRPRVKTSHKIAMGAAGFLANSDTKILKAFGTAAFVVGGWAINRSLERQQELNAAGEDPRKGTWGAMMKRGVNRASTGIQKLASSAKGLIPASSTRTGAVSVRPSIAEDSPIIARTPEQPKAEVSETHKSAVPRFGQAEERVEGSGSTQILRQIAKSVSTTNSLFAKSSEATISGFKKVIGGAFSRLIPVLSAAIGPIATVAGAFLAGGSVIVAITSLADYFSKGKWLDDLVEVLPSWMLPKTLEQKKRETAARMPEHQQPLAGDKASTKRMLADKLLSSGFTKEGAAAVLAHVDRESSWNPAAENKDKNNPKDKGALGLFQLRGVRRDKMIEAAEKAGADWRDPQFQINHFVDTLAGTRKPGEPGYEEIQATIKADPQTSAVAKKLMDPASGLTASEAAELGYELFRPAPHDVEKTREKVVGDAIKYAGNLDRIRDLKTLKPIPAATPEDKAYIDTYTQMGGLDGPAIRLRDPKNERQREIDAKWRETHKKNEEKYGITPAPAASSPAPVKPAPPPTKSGMVEPPHRSTDAPREGNNISIVAPKQTAQAPTHTAMAPTTPTTDFSMLFLPARATVPFNAFG